MFFANKATLGAVMQIIQNRFVGFDDVFFFYVVHFQRPDRICGPFPSTFKLTRFVEIKNNRRGGDPFFTHANRTVVRSRVFEVNGLFDGFSRLLASQASDFAVQSGDHSRKPNDPFGSLR